MASSGGDRTGGWPALAYLGRGVASNLLGHVLLLMQRFLLVPLFLAAWGTQRYADWLMLTSFAGYLTLLDFGGQLHIVNQMTAAHARGALTEFQQTLHTGLVLFITGPGIVIGLVAAAIYLLELDRWLPLTVASATEARWVLLILGCQFLCALPLGILLGGYRAIQEFPRGAMLGNALTGLQVLLLAVALLGQAPLWVAALVQMLPIPIAAAVAMSDLGRRHGTWFHWGLGGASAAKAISFLRPSLAYFAIQAAQAFNVQGLVLLVGATLGAPSLILFSTSRTLANLMRQALGTLSLVLWPEFARLEAQRDRHNLPGLFAFSLQLPLLACAVLVIALHHTGAFIFQVWLGGKVAFDQQIVDLMLLYVYQQVFWVGCAHFLQATGRHQALALATVADALLVLLAGWGGAHLQGLKGMILGMGLAEAGFLLWWVPVQVHRHFPSLTASTIALALRAPLTILVAGFFHPAMGIAAVLAGAWVTVKVLRDYRSRAAEVG